MEPSVWLVLAFNAPRLAIIISSKMAFWWHGWEMDGAIVHIGMGVQQCGVRGRGL